jgi:diguanylate cyclase (GGDEF)-like protein/PAS domain S-box-containing protein
VLVVRGRLAQFNEIDETVRAAGKLRALNLKIDLNTSEALNGWAPGKQIALSNIQKYQEALDAMARRGMAPAYEGRPLTPPQLVKLEQLRSSWLHYRESIESKLSGGGNFHAEANAAFAEDAGRMQKSTDQLMGSIVVDMQRGEERAVVNSYVLLSINVLVLAALFLSIRVQIVRPLRSLAQRSRELAEGNFQAHVEYQSGDEVGQLAEAFNDSAQRIGSLVARLGQEQLNLSQAESMFRGVTENSLAGVYVIQDGKYRYVNERLAQMYGYERQTMVESLSIFDTVSGPDHDRMLTNVHRRTHGDIKGKRSEYISRRQDGSPFVVETYSSGMLFEGRPAIVGIAVDITERKQEEAALRVAAMVYESSSEAMAVTDADGILIDTNAAFTRITGYSREEAIGRHIKILSSGRQNAAFYQSMWRALKTDGHWQGEIWNRRKNGELFAESLTINTSYNPDGSVNRRVALFSDITSKKKIEELVWRQANFDYLTGLPNRLMFRDRLEQAISKSLRSGLPMALMFIDLDRFKEINDTLGHAVGDLLLQQATQRLTNCVRATDTVARLGGDEFTIILGELTRTTDAERIAQKVLQSMAEPFTLDDEVAYVSASVGITFYPDDATGADDLIKNADQAMYAAKNLGRNGFHYFTPHMQEAAQARRRLAADLRVALAQQQFRVVYQPIVDLASGHICKAEALIRWEHPHRGLISPTEFIPIAEDTGLIVEIGDWVYREAASQVARWREWCPTFEISVNTSPVQYRNGGIDHASWLEHLAKLGVAANGITVEITEGLLLDTSAAVKDQLLRFRDAGIKVSLDDFGTGYSSMSYLNKLDIDYLKIDRSFITDLAPDSENVALYEAMTVMAHKLGIKVIAEGVETEAQRAILAAAGCDFAQGYLFSRPVPAEQFEEYFRQATVIQARAARRSPWPAAVHQSQLGCDHHQLGD